MADSWDMFSLSAPDAGDDTVGYVVMMTEPGTRTERLGLFRRRKLEVECLTWRIAFDGQTGL